MRKSDAFFMAYWPEALAAASDLDLAKLTYYRRIRAALEGGG